ncbi:hypothetical protein BDQ17DRAFT_1350869 [Cyathus striatus]|nr:hypothetical protein BDQ17DRAFT_1350869 [Cyathus striatus]
MGGANYMGGKRNAARARIKDHTSRIQKGFFGKQRLDILAKGFAISNSQSETAESNLDRNAVSTNTADLKLVDSTPRVQFAFAHASKKGENEGVREEYRIGYIPTPIHVSPSTPKSRERLKRRLHSNSSSNGSNGRARSNVLGSLETAERGL